MYSNPYWDEIKDRLDEVTDGLSISVGLPPRKYLASVLSSDVDLYQMPKFHEFDKNAYHQSLWHRRKEFCAKYSWAIPDPKTIAFLVQWCGQSVVEIGAGTGYFAWLLAQQGIDVHAYDIAPPQLCTDNHYHSPIDDHRELLGQTRDVYYPVETGSPEVLKRYTESTLFLCWPPYTNTMATECLEYYPGNRLIYFGENEGGCNADDDFFARLAEEWHEVASHDPVQWDAIHDYVQVFERGKDDQK